ncbi:MAG: archease [Nitrospira sp.]|nr:archease [Nitrospira sp.]
MAYRYRVLEDMALADTAFEATGDSPSELFLAAGQAIIETLADPHRVQPGCTRFFEHRDRDLAALLFTWLSDIVYLKDAEGLVFRETQARVSRDHDDWLFQGSLSGEPIDPARHELRADIKAVTKHLYEVREEAGQWIARVVLDI